MAFVQAELPRVERSRRENGGATVPVLLIAEERMNSGQAGYSLRAIPASCPWMRDFI
jgi:hypothetical protein